MTDLIFTQEQRIGLITLNRAEALNALTLPMILALQEQLQAWEQDPTIHAIVIRASPGKAFCAGGDVRWLYETGRSDAIQAMQFFAHEYRLNLFIQQLTKPYIAFMNGITMGGGVGISLHGSHPVASEQFVFAMPETTIGFFPDVGASYLLARCPEQTGTYLGLTGYRINAEEAWSLGLVKYRILSNQFDEALTTLIATDLSHNAHKQVSICLQNLASKNPPSAIPWKAAVNRAFRFDTIEAISHALQQEHTPWHQETVRTLQKKSPLSLKITLDQLLQARTKTLAECLQTDYCLANHFIQDHDFYEGVRALLIDKDKSPHWQPATLNQISSCHVNSYFI